MILHKFGETVAQ